MGRFYFLLVLFPSGPSRTCFSGREVFLPDSPAFYLMDYESIEKTVYLLSSIKVLPFFITSRFLPNGGGTPPAMLFLHLFR